MIRAFVSAKNYIQNTVSRLFKREEGATIVEYALLVGLLSICAIVAITALGVDVRAIFTSVSTEVDKTIVDVKTQ